MVDLNDKGASYDSDYDQRMDDLSLSRPGGGLFLAVSKVVLCVKKSTCDEYLLSFCYLQEFSDCLCTVTKVVVRVCRLQKSIFKEICHFERSNEFGSS